MRAELYLSQAPNTVANFIDLANSGFYDGLEIFRVVTGAFIQTGDPMNNGTGGPGYAIRGEFSENGYEGNTLSHTRGVLSMCRTEDDMDSAGSQFFIMQGSFPPPTTTAGTPPSASSWTMKVWRCWTRWPACAWTPAIARWS